jgi:hypothetical protein
MTTPAPTIESLMTDMMKLSRQIKDLTGTIVNQQELLKTQQEQLNKANSAIVNGMGIQRPTARLPDKFSGTDRKDSIESFQARMDLHFKANAHLFKNNGSKILFTIQQLEGAAFDYMQPFLPTLDTTDEPAMFHSYELLIAELTKLYGLVDKNGIYERRLDTLKQLGDIGSYVTLFNTYSAPLGWNESALLFAFKKGLSTETRDEMKRYPWTITLETTMNTAMEAYQSVMWSTWPYVSQLPKEDHPVNTIDSR